jgi:hypothetical protein
LFLIDGDGVEEAQRLLDRHVQHVGDRLALEADLQGVAVITLAVADLAGDVDVRQELHLDLDDPSPVQASQRPPLTLKEKRPAL